jgi:hypothetical protein
MPDAGGIAQGDGARDYRAAADIDIVAQRRFLEQEPVELA